MVMQSNSLGNLLLTDYKFTTYNIVGNYLNSKSESHTIICLQTVYDETIYITIINYIAYYYQPHDGTFFRDQLY